MTDFITKTLFHIPIFSTILFTLLSQVLIKSHFDGVNIVFSEEKLRFLARSFFELKVITAIFFTFLAGISWMMVMSRFSLSYAFPFLAINFGAILILDWYLFGRSIGFSALTGNIFIILGLIFISQGD